MRALIDMEASASLIEEHRYKILRNLGWLRKPVIEISQVDRKPMRMRQMVRLQVRIGETRSVHNFYITPNLCGDVILGKDCLHKHSAHKVQPYSINSKLHREAIGRCP